MRPPFTASSHALPTKSPNETINSQAVVILGVQRGGVHLAGRLANILKASGAIRFPWEPWT